MTLWKHMTALKWVSLVVMSIMAWGVTGSMGQGCVMAAVGDKQACCCRVHEAQAQKSPAGCCHPSGGGPKRTQPCPCRLGALPCGCEFVDPHRLLIYREPQQRGLALNIESRNVVYPWCARPANLPSINEHQFTGCMIPARISRHLVLGVLRC